ncbi:hypothetical protein BDZ85DRAFT_280685 [Elsinoe ampelina]|uniref:Velvet domain-containing protein n=1 Tax=Elsinoe ampelina TaxID=302913 RepID=A0A6A6GED0_9PEZI|nr:hypothetical protein BDZ85DRAFT_280685 [Elsinoe ampelina]
MFRKTSSRKDGPTPIYRKEDSPKKSRRSSHSHHSSRHAEASSSSSSSSSSRYSLKIMGQPPNLVPVGYPFQPSVLVTKRSSSSKKHSSSSRSGSIVAVISLVSACSGAALPSGVIRGQRLVSSVHDLPEDYRERLPSDLRSTAIGYVSFPSVSVTHPGSYCVKVSLLRLPESKSKSRDADTIVTIESEPFQVYNHPQYSA